MIYYIDVSTKLSCIIMLSKLKFIAYCKFQNLGSLIMGRGGQNVPHNNIIQ